jgi:hypothetical protein
MGAAAHSHLKVSPREAGLFTTQADLDVERRLTALLDDAQNPYLGYAFSQNLLNGFAQAMWIDGVLRAELITGLNRRWPRWRRPVPMSSRIRAYALRMLGWRPHRASC